MEDYMPVNYAGVRRKRGLLVDDDYKNVVVVASAWLLFYGAMFSGLLADQSRGLLARIYEIFAQN